jgi:LSD1 subclass zinc finger protein
MHIRNHHRQCLEDDELKYAVVTCPFDCGERIPAKVISSMMLKSIHALLEKKKRRRNKDDSLAPDKDNEKSEKYISNQCKRCPSCNTPISKISGCNVIKCSQCETQFCYTCGKSFNDVFHHYCFT